MCFLNQYINQFIYWYLIFKVGSSKNIPFYRNLNIFIVKCNFIQNKDSESNLNRGCSLAYNLFFIRITDQNVFTAISARAHLFIVYFQAPLMF